MPIIDSKPRATRAEGNGEFRGGNSSLRTPFRPFTPEAACQRESLGSFGLSPRASYDLAIARAFRRKMLFDRRILPFYRFTSTYVSLDSASFSGLAPLAETKSRAFHDAVTRFGGPDVHDDDASVFFSNRGLRTEPLVLLSLPRVEPAPFIDASPPEKAKIDRRVIS